MSIGGELEIHNFKKSKGKKVQSGVDASIAFRLGSAPDGIEDIILVTGD